MTAQVHVDHDGVVYVIDGDEVLASIHRDGVQVSQSDVVIVALNSDESDDDRIATARALVNVMCNEPELNDSVTRHIASLQYGSTRLMISAVERGGELIKAIAIDNDGSGAMFHLMRDDGRYVMTSRGLPVTAVRDILYRSQIESLVALESDFDALVDDPT